jgi:hypothetical protein
MKQIGEPSIKRDGTKRPTRRCSSGSLYQRYAAVSQGFEQNRQRFDKAVH